MALNGIDISSWQKGIDLSRVACDFVIVKATEGTNYVNPDCARAVEQALSLGKLVGVYHYVNGVGAEAEAEFFWKHCQGWNGRVVWAVDWEAGGNKAWGNTGYLDRVIGRLKVLCGRPPLLYASSSVFPWAVARKHDCGAWVAQYANMKATGYQSSPWSKGWSGAAIHQYSSSGRLPGYGGNLDLNIFYGDRAAWMAYAGTTSAPAAPSWELEVNGVWDSKTARRFREVLGVPGNSDWPTACKAMQYFLTWALDAYTLKRVTGSQRLEVDGSDGPATWSAFQEWWNRSGIPAGHRIAVDGKYGPETINAVKITLNHSWAGSRGFACLP